nr:ATP-binding protein [Methanobacterium formicicum]
MNPDTVESPGVNKEILASLKLKAELKLLPIVLRAVRDVACRYGLDKASVRDLELATEEACHNVIEHAYEPVKRVTTR